MDLRKLKTLIDLVSESGITELEITEAEGTVRIVKGSNQPMMMSTPMMQQHLVQAAGAPLAPVVAAAAEPIAPVIATGHPVKSPMVGTFYRSASPGSEPFVQVGQTVTQGQTICIIEAMKLLNEIEADKAGTIMAVSVENGQAVEYGQTLFIIE
jgi:acetyl-CoA carboxylase biotin carboxyl carrier protein